MHDPASGTVQRARQLRREISLPEAMLWRLLKPKPLGVKFRSQHPLGDYVVDFFCHSASIVFEVDGISQNMGDQPEFDAERDNVNALGYAVVRITAVEVLKNPEAVAESMVRHCLATSGALH